MGNRGQEHCYLSVPHEGERTFNPGNCCSRIFSVCEKYPKIAFRVRNGYTNFIRILLVSARRYDERNW